MLLPFSIANLTHYYLPALHPQCVLWVSAVLLGDTIRRSSCRTWSHLQVRTGCTGSSWHATHGQAQGCARWDQPASPWWQWNGMSKSQSILQSVCKAHIFSFNQFRGGNWEWRKEIFIPLGHYGSEAWFAPFPWACIQANTHPVCCNRRSIETQCPRKNSKCDLSSFGYVWLLSF